MAQTKVSELSALTTTDGAEELLINDGGTSKKVTIDNVLHDNSIRAEHYVDGSIATAHLADGAITAAKIADGTVVAAELADNAVTTAKINADAVTGAKIADDAIDSEHYVDASIDNAHLADDAVGIPELSATGTASSTTFLRGDNAWAVPIGGVTSVNSVTGAVTAANIATAVEAASDSNTFTDADHTKLNAIEASADVTDATNVTAAGALMDSELAGIAAVKATTGTFLSADESKLDGIAASANNYVHPNHSGEVTSTADGATVIADNIVDEANLKVSNSPSNGYVLSAQSGNTGGLTWAEIATGNTTSNPMWEMAHTVSSNYTMTTNYNGVSVAPVTINSSVSVTVPSGSTWTIV